MLETLLDSTPCPDQESLGGSSDDPEMGTALMLHPENMLDRLHPIPADSDDSDADRGRARRSV